MSTVQDIMGVALRDYIEGVRDVTFVHRDDGFSAREQIERYFRGYNEWCEIERNLLKRLRGRILELGCNIGAHLHYLQREGLAATGIDMSAGAISLAKEKGIKNCFVMDAREMTFEQSFDIVLMLYYGFGLGGTFDRQRKLLGDIYKLTSNDGQIICSSIDALRTEDLQHIAYQAYNEAKGKDHGDVTQVTLRIQHRHIFGDWYDLLFINPNGLRRLVEGTGWKVKEVIPEDKNCRAWYYVLVK